MEIIVTMWLTYGGKREPGKKSLQTIQATIANEIENGGLDLSLGNRELIESVTLAESAKVQESVMSTLEMAEGWIDAHRDSEDTGDGQNDKFVLDCVKAAIKDMKGGA